MGCIAERLTVLAVVLPVLQSLPLSVWIAMTLGSVCAWALIAVEFRSRKERQPAREEPAPATVHRIISD
jgi:hypothetical protein